jgi:hypothetical protein
MNMDAEKIFDAVGKLGVLVHLKHEHSQKLEQLRSVQSRRCGNCFHWMKSSCIPEKKHKQFKSRNSFACKDFELYDLGVLIPKFKAELAEIENRLEDFTKPTLLNTQR